MFFSCEDKGIKINKKVLSKLLNVKAKVRWHIFFVIFCLIFKKVIFVKMEDLSFLICFISFHEGKRN